jgi:hypothetical protein
MASDRTVRFAAPTWLRDLGFASWLLVGFVLIIVGLVWLLGETSTIVMPVTLAAVLGAVAGPAVVIGSHRISGLRSHLLGSTSRTILEHCTRPVVVVRADDVTR